MRNAVIEKKVSLGSAHFYTTLSGDGNMAGESDGVMRDLVLSDTATYNFMPLWKILLLVEKLQCVRVAILEMK